jgi:hypothetical protein
MVVATSAPNELPSGPLTVSAEDPIAAILADLSAGTVTDVQQEAASTTDTSPILAAAADKTPAKTSFAVYRPSSEAAIDAVPINLPAPLPDREPFEDHIALIADLPRNERKLAEINSPYIERVSLGEVKLVTLPFSTVDEDAVDFDNLGKKLALWAEDERRSAAFESRTGLKGRFAIQSAIERAAVAEAIASLESTVDQMDSSFAYTTFAGEADGQEATTA